MGPDPSGLSHIHARLPRDHLQFPKHRLARTPVPTCPVLVPTPSVLQGKPGTSPRAPLLPNSGPRPPGDSSEEPGKWRIPQVLPKPKRWWTSSTMVNILLKSSFHYTSWKLQARKAKGDVQILTPYVYSPLFRKAYLKRRKSAHTGEVGCVVQKAQQECQVSWTQS